MRCLGVIGGMSWESTALYYRLLNQHVAARLGGLHSARLQLHSVDFAPVAAMLARADWDAIAQHLGEAARGLKAAGASGLVLATNTMHKVADRIEAAAQLPVLHIADATAAALSAAGFSRVGLLGTRFTMEDEGIISTRLAGRGEVQVIVPGADDRTEVNRVIFDELCRGVIDASSRERYVSIIGRLRDQGAQAVILGCTEITLLIDATCSPLPVFDSTALHAAAAAEWMFGSPTT
jgi:aspartate racemase